MNPLLVWPLTESLFLHVCSPQKTLANITCCDELTLMLKMQKNKAEDMQSEHLCAVYIADFLKFKRDLVALGAGQLQTSNLQNILKISVNQHGFEVLVRDFSVVIDVAVLQSWIGQIDLLNILMQENEQEAKERGRGCCG
jgi:hypothetical protein